MAYLPNIPQSSDLISQSQPQILANFQALTSWGNGYGDFPVQSAAPSFSSGHNGIYNLNNATNLTNELYVHLQRTAPGDAPTDIPFTMSKLDNTAMASCLNGWTYLPSGLIVKWGTVAANAASIAIDVAATSGGPAFNLPLIAFVTPFDTALTTFTCGVKSSLTAVSGNFTAYTNNFSATCSIKYLVIGV